MLQEFYRFARTYQKATHAPCDRCETYYNDSYVSIGRDFE